MAKVVRAKKAAAGKSDSGKSVQKVVQLRMDFMVSNGNGDRENSFEAVQDRIRELILAEFPNARFTPTGGYYILDGKVCRPGDFDRETMDRKPGTFPPLWSLTAEEQAEVKRQQRVLEDAVRPNTLARQPANLRTSRELDELKKQAEREQQTVRRVSHQTDELRALAKEAEKEQKKVLRRISQERPDLIPAEEAPKKQLRRIVRK